MTSTSVHWFTSHGNGWPRQTNCCYRQCRVKNHLYGRRYQIRIKIGVRKLT